MSFFYGFWIPGPISGVRKNSGARILKLRHAGFVHEPRNPFRGRKKYKPMPRSLKKASPPVLQGTMSGQLATPVWPHGPLRLQHDLHVRAAETITSGVWLPGRFYAHAAIGRAGSRLCMVSRMSTRSEINPMVVSGGLRSHNHMCKKIKYANCAGVLFQLS